MRGDTELQTANFKLQTSICRKFLRVLKRVSSVCSLQFALCSLPFCAPLFAAGEPDAWTLTGIGARAGGMGNAFIGLSDEIESVYYNPAGLGNLVQSGVTAMYQAPSIETSRGFVGFNKRWIHPRFPGSIALGWLRLRSSDIELTNTDEKVIGTDTLTNDLWLLGLGVHPFPHWSLGGSMKYYRFAFNGFSEAGFGADLGVHAQYNPVRFGLTVSDFTGTKLKGSSIDASSPDARDPIAARLRPGVAFVSHSPFNWPVDASLDVDGLIKLAGSQDARVFSGGEVWAFEGRGALRSGFEQGTGPTFGFGARFGIFQIDYAYLYSFHLRDEHRISTTARF